MLFNGQSIKIVRGILVGTLATTLITAIALGVEARIQTVVGNSDSVKTATSKIAILENLMEKNIEEDNRVHPEIKVLQSQIINLTKTIENLDRKLEAHAKKLEDETMQRRKLTDLLIKYMSEK